MRGFLIAFSLLIFSGVGACAQENNIAAIEAVDDVVGKLDEAFEAQDAEAIKAFMTADHVAVTPYYGTPRSVDDVIALLPELNYQQTDLSEPQVSPPGSPDPVNSLRKRILSGLARPRRSLYNPIYLYTPGGEYGYGGGSV